MSTFMLLAKTAMLASFMLKCVAEIIFYVPNMTKL